MKRKMRFSHVSAEHSACANRVGANGEQLQQGISWKSCGFRMPSRNVALRWDGWATRLGANSKPASMVFPGKARVSHICSKHGAPYATRRLDCRQHWVPSYAAKTATHSSLQALMEQQRTGSLAAELFLSPPRPKKTRPERIGALALVRCHCCLT